MSRPLRIEYDGALYHITSRGNAREAIFLNDEDRKLFLDILGSVKERSNWLCHAYCLMDNHYHLIVETPEGNLSKGMRQLNGVYTQRFNKQHNRVGHLFQGRYKAIVVDKENYLLEMSRYVVLNPVRAKAVKKPEEWKWSSYLGTAGLEKPHQLLTSGWILGRFGREKKKARDRYITFVQEGISGRAIWDELAGQCLLGTRNFVDRLKKYLDNRENVKEIPVRQRLIGRPALEALFPEGKVRSRLERNAIIEAATKKHGYEQKQVADHLNLHYSTISRLLNEKSKIASLKT